MKRMKKPTLTLLVNILLLVLLSAALSGCGFKLRGADMPEGMQKIYVKGSGQSDVVKDLKTLLGYTPSGVAASEKDAEAILEINDELIKRRTISVGSLGRTRESELQYTVVYTLTNALGEMILANQKLFLVRDFIDDADDVIGRQNEAELIERELKRDAASQIIRRLQVLKPVATTAQ
ncbi:MAG: hypothetical protein A6F71_01735 [Cycloclasticus sp. symbiont of Poecilosclerida sp. M]|nr:MAG: hypothetical protein A6F71_01735 [Cycloclasticus sp. symbiont of Poecilosclerida sp. M]